MKTSVVWIFFCALLTICLSGCSSNGKPNRLSPKEKKDGWILLFDGYTTNGWQPLNGKETTWLGWKVENGLLINHPPAAGIEDAGGDIITTGVYADFEFSWEWKLVTIGGNSGVKYYVVRELSGDSKHGIGPEYQILDDQNHEMMLQGKMTPGDYRTVGALYELYNPVNQHPNPTGSWNHSRIVCKENVVEHWLNGHRTVEYKRGSEDFREKVKQSKFHIYPDFGEAEGGYILLQDHGSEVHFRNLKIRNL
jgi:hypothetical protein